jgi:hypothetical protein
VTCDYHTRSTFSLQALGAGGDAQPTQGSLAAEKSCTLKPTVNRRIPLTASDSGFGRQLLMLAGKNKIDNTQRGLSFFRDSGPEARLFASKSV